MQAQHRAAVVVGAVLVVGVDEERERAAVGAGRRLDHVRNVALLGLVVEEAQVLARVLDVLLQVEVGAVGDAFELLPADRELVLDVGAALGVVRELVGGVLAQAQVARDWMP